jgi:hypothetical protein
MRRSRPAPWYTNVLARRRFEGAARAEYPDLAVRTTGRGRRALVIYHVTVPVPDYEDRKVEIRLRNGFEPWGAEIFADGPTESPHRFGERRLCIWREGDAPNRRWTGEQGLCELLRHISIHLFKETYYRETGDWIGDEAPHGPLEEEDAA